uniref:Uncharacterized protein n=1 Tax=Romanomermis culicivorax TaxID=13658 RepID=A0A915I679_ROMCU
MLHAKLVKAYSEDLSPDNDKQESMASGSHRELRFTSKHFFQECTTVGLANLASSKTGDEKFFWSSIFLFCTIFACWMCVDSCLDYASFQVRTDFKIEKWPMDSKEGVGFPSITFCPLHVVKESMYKYIMHFNANVAQILAVTLDSLGLGMQRSTAGHPVDAHFTPGKSTFN